MASVFRAYQPSLERYVAIKVLPPSFASRNPVFVKRFEREARAIARLHHPNILPIYDFGIDQDYSYIVMRYVEGAQTLGQSMPFSFSHERVVALISQVASALTYAHQHGVIHRDVKPSNILLDGEWALLSDFGLARVEEASGQLTDSGVSLGTPAYMSPEQARGDSVDHHTDIYSLGVIVYEMLTHTIPHNAPTPVGILMKRMTLPPPSPRTLNPAISTSVEQVVLRSLAVNPVERYESATDYAAALKQALANETSPALPAALPARSTTALDPDALPSPSLVQEAQARKGPSNLRRFTGPGLAVLGLLGLLLAWWAGPVLRSPTTLPGPAEMTPLAAIAPPPTPTVAPATPTTSPATPLPAPSPTPTPREPAIVPTATPVIVVVTATATDQPSPSPTPTAGLPTEASTATSSPSPALPGGTFVLLNPLSLERPSYGPTTFEWEWSGPLPDGFGFEVRVWREGEPPAGVHDAVLDNRQGRIEKIGENRYRLQVDIRQAAGVRERTGEYLWTVALVQLSPTYADLGLQAEPARLRFEAGGGKGGGEDGGSPGGIS
jgi:serine/threonine-protein kinase